MGQQTAFGEAEATAYVKVARLSGAVELYRVEDGVHVEVSLEEYEAATGDTGSVRTDAVGEAVTYGEDD